MSTKLLHSLTNERTDMQKQLGCMNGIFQLFDRHKFFPGRRATGHNHKRLLPGQDINCRTEQKGIKEKTLVGKQKLMATIELSRPSFSSSCSSSTFSSAECNKTSQSEPISSQSSFQETTSFPNRQQSSCSHLSPQSLDIRDIVKGSMYKESPRLSVKIMVEEEKGDHKIYCKESPRPLDRKQPVQPTVQHDGSPRVLAKLNDAPRYSYDERESQNKLKSTTRLKELPRLSLDSKERSLRNSASQLRSNNLAREICSSGSASASQMINVHPEPGSNKRPSTIVARLMGLESITDNSSTDNDQMRNTECSLDEDSDTISCSSKMCDESKQKQISGSPRISSKSPHLRNGISVTKSTSSSRFPQEPAPRRQSNQCSKKQQLQDPEASNNSPHASRSVYGDIEKRLTELEFQKSGKDLRALKQILEAMEKMRVRFGNTKELTLSSDSRKSSCIPYHSFDEASAQQRQSKYPILPIIKGTNSPRRYGTQILTTKPAKQEKPEHSPDCTKGLQRKWSGDNAENIKDLVERRIVKDIPPRKNHLRHSSSWPHHSIDEQKRAKTNRSSEHPKPPQHKGGENPASFRTSSGTSSSRLQQKKHEVEKLSCLTTQTSGSRGAKKKSMKQPKDSVSPTTKYKQRQTNLQQGDDQLSWSSSEARNSSRQADTVSMQSNSGISFASHSDIDVTSTDQTKQSTGLYELKDPNEEDFLARFRKDRFTAELATSTLEQPSPVSVLDSKFYDEDCPSPVKKRSTAFQDYDSFNIDEARWTAEYTDHFQNSKRCNPCSKFNQRKLEYIDKLAHELQIRNFSHDEATTTSFESLSDDTSPDHRYVAEILVAAGILIDPGSRSTTTQLHPSGFSVNPNLFHVLEISMGNSETEGKHQKRGAQAISNDKMGRKLVFDIVNEIIVQQSALAGSGDPWILQNKMGARWMSGKKLFKELCSKLDHQQATTESSLDGEDRLTNILRADMMNEPEIKGDYTSEHPGIVLQIERLIFKDLIDEIVCDGAAALQVHPGRHCRKLFTK